MLRFVAAVALTAAAAGSTPLKVPYLPQTEALCGGASAAMVMRYWGARDVYADDFASLVDRSAGGIRESALVGALEARRWTAVAGAGDLERMRGEIGRGRPVIALIEVRPGRYHYVVVVAADADEIVVHDPARAPSRAMPAAKFDAAWQKTERWMLVLLPPEGASVERASPRPMPPKRSVASTTPLALEPREASCAAVDEGVALAKAGDQPGARRALEQAATSCPGASAPWRELAGLDALEGQWGAAAEHANRAVQEDSSDEYAWRVLATARFVLHDDLAALDAWNRVGEPRADLVNITGLQHTRYLVVADAIGVQPKDLLTPMALQLAQRRVREVPAIATARVTYHPTEDGRAQLDAAILERDRVPAGYPAWLGIGLGAAVNRELTTTFANVSGGGDMLAVTWRWWEHRPMAAVSYAAPGPGGVWRFDVSRETQTFGAQLTEETRSRVGVEIGNWIDRRTKLRGGVAFERWRDLGREAAVMGGVQFWPVMDRLSLEAGVTTWQGEGAPFSSAAGVVRFRSKTPADGNVWLFDGGYRIATTSAPASVWPGADTGHARDVLLRAHPLLDDGVIAGGVFGRRVASGGVEAQHWLAPGRHLVRIAPAAFVDLARATRGLPTTDDRLHVDAGVGLRLSLFGMGVLRVDVAHGLRDGSDALSIGWQR